MTGRLFDEPSDEPEATENRPLAERLRPRALEDFVGQPHLVGEGALLRRLLAATGAIPSLVLWGPPGSGKTSLARILAGQTAATFVALSAVHAGVKEVRAAIEEATRRRSRGLRTVLFLDEIHRFNKSQQDALLPAVEDGTLSLIGATTENPSFEVNAALLSRARVLVLNPLTPVDVRALLNRALEDRTRGLGTLNARVSDELLDRLASASGGDARVALTALESAVLATAAAPDGTRTVSSDSIVEAIGRARFGYDKGGEDHYNLASALIKSLRNSNVNAALYWLARLIEGGADPLFIARRLCILASEDIGLADPSAMVHASAAAQITQLIGLPEAIYPLTQATIYLARAPKSNSVKTAYFAAAEDAEASAREPVPLHLRNAVTSLMKQAGYGKNYRYVHADPAARTEMPCLPEGLQDRRYFAEDAARAGAVEPPAEASESGATKRDVHRSGAPDSGGTPKAGPVDD